MSGRFNNFSRAVYVQATRSNSPTEAKSYPRNKEVCGGKSIKLTPHPNNVAK